MFLGAGVADQSFAQFFDCYQIKVTPAVATAIQTIQRKLGIAAIRNVRLLIVIFLDQIARLFDEGIILGRKGITPLVLAVHPDIDGYRVLPDTQLMSQPESGTVAQQAVVANLREDRPLVGCQGIEAGDGDLIFQGDIIGALILRHLPGVIAAALDLGHSLPITVDIDSSEAVFFVITVSVHCGDGMRLGLTVRDCVLVDLNEDALHCG